MRINLAKVVPVALPRRRSSSSGRSRRAPGGGSADDYESDSYDYSDPTDTTRADAYLNGLAVKLAQPGLWVDPAVLAGGELTADEASRLDAVAADTAGPVRVAVIPADAVREGDGSSAGGDLAYADDELVAQLYDRVGVDGTYAILVDAELVVRRPLVHGVPVVRGAALLRGRRRPWTRRSTAARPTTTRCSPPSSSTPTRSRPTRGRSSAGRSAASRCSIALVARRPGLRTDVGARSGTTSRWPTCCGRPLQEEVVELSGEGGRAAAGARGGPRPDQQRHPPGAGPGRGGPAPAGHQRGRRRHGHARGGGGRRTPPRGRPLPARRHRRPAGRASRRPSAPRRASSTRGTGRASASAPYTPEFGAERDVPVCAEVPRPARRGPGAGDAHPRARAARSSPTGSGTATAGPTSTATGSGDTFADPTHAAAAHRCLAGGAAALRAAPGAVRLGERERRRLRRLVVRWWRRWQAAAASAAARARGAPSAAAARPRSSRRSGGSRRF